MTSLVINLTHELKVNDRLYYALNHLYGRNVP